jgi:hypothetical protein
MPHYLNAEEPFMLVLGTSSSGVNQITIGGGSSSANTATKISFYTASHYQATLGTERAHFSSGGNFFLDTAPTNDNSETSILVRQSDGEIQTRAASTIGITNSGSSNELVKSDGTNLVGTGITSSVTGVLSRTGDINLSTTTGAGAWSDNATNNAVYNTLTIQHSTSGTPSAGIGTSVDFGVETSAGNNETIAAIEAVTTDVTSTSEDGDLVFKTMSGGSTATEKLRVTSDGRLYGTALHNNAGAITGTTNQYIASGTYTPTITNTSNVSASTPAGFKYIRVGNVVTVSGTIDIDAVATGQFIIGISLPIPSDFSDSAKANGVGSASVNTDSGGITSDSTNDRATYSVIAGSTSNTGHAIHFTYVIE